MLRVRTKYAPGVCDYKGGYREVRWDASECNLRCAFCWSPASRPSETGDPARVLSVGEVVTRTMANVLDPSRTFIRFTGGEPTLQWSQLHRVLDELHDAMNGLCSPILIQTNGIEIGKGSIDLSGLGKHSQQRYLFELSLKGTNPTEFSLLTGKSPDLYDLQLAGLNRLQRQSQLNPNIAAVAVLGVYHSSTHGPSKYVFVDPESGQILFDDDTRWDPRFSSLWESAPMRWVEPLRMTPPGLWKNVLRRAGDAGAGILRYVPVGMPTNVKSLFPPKPASGEYARQIVTGEFWH